MSPRRLLLLTLAALAGGCGDQGPPRIDRIEVTVVGGGPFEVRKGSVLRLQARAYSGDRERTDAEIRFRSENPEVATVDSVSGLVRGIDFGTAQIAVDANRGEHTTRVSLEVVGAPVASLSVEPGDTATVIGGRVQLRATAFDAQGHVLVDAEVTWETDAPGVVEVVGVGLTGTATGVASGTARVEVVAWNRVRAAAVVTVLPVTGFAPDSGAFGTTVVLRGSGLPAEVGVAFPAAGGEAVDAPLRETTPDSVVLWVPVGAVTGPLAVTVGGVPAETAEPFTVTGGGDDLYEENDDPSFDNPEIGVGFYNPELIALASDTLDWYLLPIAGDEGEFTVEVRARTSTEPGKLLQGAFFRLEEGSQLRWVGGYFPVGALTYDFIADTAVPVLRFARKVEEPDTFFLLLGAFGKDIPYSLEVKGEGVYLFEPDPYEENDAVNRAPQLTVPVTVEAVAENGGELDFFNFTVGDSAVLTAELGGTAGDVDLFIFGDLEGPGDFGSLLGQSVEIGPDERLELTVGPGTYSAGVWEFAMQGGAYTLRLETAPPGTGVAAPAPGARLPGGGPGPGAGPGWPGKGGFLPAGGVRSLYFPVPVPGPFTLLPPWERRRP